MADKKLGRRGFLKLTAAAAAAAGLSHFEFLNASGPNVAFARQCEPGDLGSSDTCDQTSVDHCIPQSADGGDPDLCSPDPGLLPADMCPDDSPQGDGDNCDPGQEADVCVPGADPDQCAPAEDDPDVCVGDTGTGSDGDQCTTPPDDADICEMPGTDPPDNMQCSSGPVQDLCQSVDMDICHSSEGVSESQDACDPLNDPDACEPDAGEADKCFPGFDPDVCPDNGGDADICEPDTTGELDVCSPTWDPDQSDQPTPVTVTSLAAGPASKAWPALGGLLTIVGAAALWLRRNLGDTESDPD